MQTQPHKTSRLKKRNLCGAYAGRAFTLPELLVVIATLAILAAVLLPALAGSPTPNVKSYQCLNNMRQMAQAWTLYAEDNHDWLAINSDPHVNNTYLFPSSGGGPAWISGTLDWTSGRNNTNTAYLTQDSFSLLGGYLGRSTNVFACPATATFVSPAQRTAGYTQRSRSIAMNAAVGNGYKYGTPSNPFGWATWYYARKSADFHTPGPSSVWVFADEHPDSIDDSLIYTSDYATSTFTELHGSQHEGACGLTFADGHAALHKWQGIVARQPVTFTTRQMISCATNDPDMIWLSQHTPVN